MSLLCEKTQWKQCCIDRCVVVSFKIWAQGIDYKTIDYGFISYIFYCYFTLIQNMVVQFVLKSQTCTLFRILHSYPEVKRLSQILYHYWTIPLRVKGHFTENTDHAKSYNLWIYDCYLNIEWTWKHIH